MYPKINEMIDILHSKGISSFLVTNAQFPEAIRYNKHFLFACFAFYNFILILTARAWKGKAVAVTF